MAFNDGFSVYSIPYVTGSNGEVLTIVNGQWVAGAGLDSIVSAVSTSNGIIGDGTDGNPVRLDGTITVQNLYVEQTASIAHLDYIYQQSLVVGDKYITLMSGANDHSLMNGAGILWGSGSTDPTTGDQGSTAYILYRNNTRDQLEIFPGLYISGSLTASSGISGSLLGTSSYAFDADKLDGFHAAAFAQLNATASFTQITGTVGITSPYIFSNQFTGSYTGSYTGSFIGDGSRLTNLTGSSVNFPNFQSDVRNQLSGGANINYTTGTIAVINNPSFISVTASAGFRGDLTGSFNSSNPSIIDVSSSIAALRVTQRGLGDSLRVEDDTTPDNTPFIIKNDGKVGIGIVSPISTLQIAGSLIQGLNLRTFIGTGSHAEGNDTYASGSYSHTEGRYTGASGSYAHAEGDASQAYGSGSHAEGYNCKAFADYSHAEGDNTKASGIASHAEGYYAITYGERSHAEGYGCTASANYSHAEGYLTVASGVYSHAEGYGPKAIGDHSHAEGYASNAYGPHSHTEGRFTNTYGTASHSEGLRTVASGNYSHAEGVRTVASGTAQHVAGLWNATSSDALYIIGNGTGSSPTWEDNDPNQVILRRSNIFEVYNNRVVVSGSLSITGGFQTPIRKVTSDYSFVTGSDLTVLFSGSALTGTLPEASQATGFTFIAKNLTTNPLFITASSGKIDDSTIGLSFNTQYAAYTFQSDGTDWYKL